MTAQLINGKETALALREALAAELAQKGHRPHLAVVLAGDDEASLIYDRNKQKAAWAAGMDCDLHHRQDRCGNVQDMPRLWYACYSL